MSQGPWGSAAEGAVPPPAYGDLWYLQGEAEALGPYNENDIKAMIEAGAAGPASLVARVGATQWSAVADVPAFATVLPAAASAPVRYAGFWIRLVAYLIDLVLVYLLSMVAGVIVIGAFVAAAGGSIADPTPAQQAAVALASLGAALFYYIYFPSRAWQATPGKRICGIHIVRTDGRPVTGMLAFGRYLSYIVSGLPLGLGFLMAGWSGQKKALHDIICGTRVVHGRL